MSSLLDMSSEKTFILLFFGGLFVVGGVIALVAIIAHYVCHLRSTEQENTLKLEMIQRGHSADEIAKVLNARKLEDADYFKQWLVEKGLKGDDISTVVNAGWWDKIMK